MLYDLLSLKNTSWRSSRTGCWRRNLDLKGGKKKCGPEGGEVIQEWRKWHNEEQNGL